MAALLLMITDYLDFKIVPKNIATYTLLTGLPEVTKGLLFVKYKDGFGIKSRTKVDIPLNKESKPT